MTLILRFRPIAGHASHQYFHQQIRQQNRHYLFHPFNGPDSAIFSGAGYAAFSVAIAVMRLPGDGLVEAGPHRRVSL
ncbi:MFS transporter [Chitinophaga silvisoli]|uniref:MFS transporter n=1 Tax=Chitinophaga silvisoli TaxID=2291814 RepID=UPI0011C0FC5E|nr:MFS transporter [Chitinophaga silvisoli]